LNSGPPVPQTGALTGLRYAPKIGGTIVGGHLARNIGPQQPLGPQHPLAIRKSATYSRQSLLPSLLPNARFAGSPLKRLFSATFNSLRGLRDGFATEPALREELVLLVVAVPLAFFLAPSAAWFAAMIGAVLVILAVEFLNTGLEKLSDHVTPEQHKDIRRIKDFGSAAVFCALCLTGLVWMLAIAVRCGLL
jgi:diacylglycerol kinase (ATP)